MEDSVIHEISYSGSMGGMVALCSCGSSGFFRADDPTSGDRLKKFITDHKGNADWN